MLREDEKRNRRFFDGHMVESEANLQRELERERCLLLLHPRFRFVNLQIAWKHRLSVSTCTFKKPWEARDATELRPKSRADARAHACPCAGSCTTIPRGGTRREERNQGL